MAAEERLNETLRLLTSIDVSLKAIARALVKAAPAEVADDRELDSQYGDPPVKFNPRDWTGDSYKGRHFSECPPDFLDMLASAFDYFAKKSDDAGELTAAGKPKSLYSRKDAARARGWAKRHRERGFDAEAPQLATVGDDGFGGFDAGDEWNS